MQLCDYGCNQEAKFQLKNGKWCCSKHTSSCLGIKRKNSENVKKAHEEGRIPGWNNIKGLNRSWSKGLTKETDNRIKKHSESLKEGFATGRIINKFKDKKHTKETKEILSKKRIAYLESENSNVKWFSIQNIKGEIVKVQGTWEYKTAQKLNELNIYFIRKRLKYLEHKTYTSDFYLPEFDFYLEVKGFFKERDKIKMFHVLDSNENIKIKMIFSLSEIDDLKNKNDIYNLKFFHNICNKEDINYSVFDKTIKYKLTWCHDRVFVGKNKNFFHIKEKFNVKYDNVPRVISEQALHEYLVKERRNLLNESGIDIMKFGWVGKVAKLWNVSHTQVKRWIENNYLDLNFYIRN